MDLSCQRNPGMADNPLSFLLLQAEKMPNPNHVTTETAGLSCKKKITKTECQSSIFLIAQPASQILSSSLCLLLFIICSSKLIRKSQKPPPAPLHPDISCTESGFFISHALSGPNKRLPHPITKTGTATGITSSALSVSPPPRHNTG